MATKKLSLILLLALAGCATPVNETHRGRLETGDSVLEQDGSFYDSFGFEAKEGSTIILELESEDFDPYVHLMDADSQQITHNDDGAPGSTASRIEYTADRTGVYYAVVNSRRGNAQGDYVVRIKVEPK